MEQSLSLSGVLQAAGAITFTEAVALAAAGLVFMSGMVYVLDMVHGRIRPSVTTWFIWGLVQLALLVNYRDTGAEESSWVAIADFAIPCIVVLYLVAYLLIRGGVNWKVDAEERPFVGLSFVGCIAALALFRIEDPLTGLLVAVLADFAGAAPTIRKSRRHPESESRLAWTLFTAGNALNLLAVGEYVEYVYPIAMTGIGALILAPLLRRK